MTRVIPVTRPAEHSGESFAVQIVHEKIEELVPKGQWPVCKSE
jgi:hypothetical protein